MAGKINQKEYLKKYLGGDVGGEKKKKKKKRPKEIKGKTVTVVDDNVDLRNLVDADDEEIEAALLMNEEAPQVVGIIDERPAEMKAADLQKSGKWKGLKETNFINESSNSSGGDMAKFKTDYFKMKSKHKDNSPQRKRRDSRSPDLSPRRRKSKSPDLSPRRRRRPASPDCSPQRNRRKKSPDLSPPRKRSNNRSPDLSPRRQRNHSPDLSPPRKPHTKRRSPEKSSPRRKKSRWGTSPDLSPPRKQKRSPSPDLSPPRRKSRSHSPKRRRSRDLSPPRKPQTNRILSPPRRSSPLRTNRQFKQDRYRDGPHSSRRKASESPPPTHGKRGDGKMERTMDGKKAGLQDADGLKDENEKHRRREAEMYEQMSSEMSGRDAEARVRRTGAVDRRKLEEQLSKEREREEKYQQRKEVYDKWGKGVKQLQDYEAKLEEAAKEMSKPLARYAGDQDLERHLKDQDRIGDPMLEYIRSKRKETKVKDRVKEKPIYQGLFPDNRFNIRPGYRWDGVDRSNGYEKRFFEAVNAREAMQEEAYRYSTEDM